MRKRQQDTFHGRQKLCHINIFFGPWSISLNSKEYDIEPENIEVILTSGSQSYKFSKSNQSNGYFNVDTGHYGLGPAIIFQPDVLSLSETSEIM